MAIFHQLPDSVLQLLAVFLSIIIEALPFVLLGSILSGFIEVFVTPEKVQNFLPKNKVLAILFGTLIGFIFPSCECGIVPIITRFLEKKVPSYTAIPFMATAPIINPVVLFATYTAFGNSWYYVLLRFVGAFLIAMILGILLGFVVDDQILKDNRKASHVHDYSGLSAGKKVFQALVHAVDEFFDTGRYLIFGSLVAASMQTYLPTRILTTIGHNSVTAILIMMLLAFILFLVPGIGFGEREHLLLGEVRHEQIRRDAVFDIRLRGRDEHSLFPCQTLARRGDGHRVYPRLA